MIAVTRLSLFSTDWGKFSLSPKNTRTFFQAWPTFPSVQPRHGHRWLSSTLTPTTCLPCDHLTQLFYPSPPNMTDFTLIDFHCYHKSYAVTGLLKNKPLTWMKMQPCKISKDKFPMGFPNRFQCLLTWLTTFGLLHTLFKKDRFNSLCFWVSVCKKDS